MKNILSYKTFESGPVIHTWKNPESLNREEVIEILSIFQDMVDEFSLSYVPVNFPSIVPDEYVGYQLTNMEDGLNIAIFKRFKFMQPESADIVSAEFAKMYNYWCDNIVKRIEAIGFSVVHCWIPQNSVHYIDITIHR